MTENNPTFSRGDRQCVKCNQPATHMRILKDERPNPPEIMLCEDHAKEGDKEV